VVVVVEEVVVDEEVVDEEVVVVVEPGMVVVVCDNAQAPFIQTQPKHKLTQSTDSNEHILELSQYLSVKVPPKEQTSE
jgi:hypothetical protein